MAERFALRGYFDGRYKYVRYYGVGDAVDTIGRGIPWAQNMRFGPDASFFDHEHEMYDLHNDPGEIENLANVRSRRSEIAERFDHLLELEAASFTHVRPAGPHDGSTGESDMMSYSGYELGDEVDLTTGTIRKVVQ